MRERYIREIISSFPYPIAATFVRLRTDECLDPGPLRLKYILATGEAISRFLGVVTLCECRELLEEKPELVLSPGISGNFTAMFKRPAWGAWLQFIREGQKWLLSCQKDTVLPELADFALTKNKESKSLAALGQMLTLRNGLSHEKIQAMHKHEFKSLCDQAYPLLEEILEALDFLLDSELSFVSRIEVHKLRSKDADFKHRFKKIIGNSSDFHGDRDTRADYLDSHSVILFNLENKRFLNLDPLLLYEEEAGKAPDVFFYNGMKKPETAAFSSCKYGGDFNAKDSERGGQIAAELQAMLDAFSPEKEIRKG